MLFISAEHDHNMNKNEPCTSSSPNNKKLYKSFDWSKHYSGNKKGDPFDKRSYQYLLEPEAVRVSDMDQRSNSSLETPYDPFNDKRFDHGLPEILLAIDREDKSPLYRNPCRGTTSTFEIDNQTRDDKDKKSIFQKEIKKEFL